MFKKALAVFKRHMLPDHRTVQVYEGEPVDEIIQKDHQGRYVLHTHTCCDCNLRHTVRIDIRRTKLIYRYWRHS